MKIIEHFICCLIAAYMTEECPKLLLEYLTTPEDVSGISWKHIVEERMFNLPIDTDEHVYKLMQVCHDMTKIRPQSEGIYKRASLSALDHELAFAINWRQTWKPHALKQKEKEGK